MPLMDFFLCIVTCGTIYAPQPLFQPSAYWGHLSLLSETPTYKLVEYHHVE